jgi:carbamate kinase
MRKKSDLIVVALGGNAIQRSDDDSVTSDFEHTTETASRLVSLIETTGHRLVVTHGNGPQVGNHLLRSQLGHDHGNLPLLPLDVCVADTQGGMGYMLQQTLTNAFHDRHLPAVVASIVTQVVVERDDPAFENPTKPVGETIPGARADEFRERGWTLAFDKRRDGWRRVVASPDPHEIVEAAAISALVDAGIVVVASGGGGVPVVMNEEGDLVGVPAVIDKDLASALLAEDLKADALIIATDVDRAYVDYGTPEERPLDRVTVEEARSLLDLGEFGAGSMGPKVEALCRFVERSGGVGIITSIDLCDSALSDAVGTRIVP